MKKLLLATTNKAKQEEILFGLKPLIEQGLIVISLSDVDIQEYPEETGVTFEENAKLKAKYYAEKTGLPALADDGGIMIDALGGKPGVKSRRWPGYEATDKELIDYALKKLKDVPADKRTAKLVTCVCFYYPKVEIPSLKGVSEGRGVYVCEQEQIEGFMTDKPLTMETNGYPYRALFKVLKFNKFYDELTHEEHDAINHRLLAIKRLIPTIQKYLLQ
ncbi:RdgB/HAM1 family non-canonical purine NTP pyrophosphatase [soil metagenome]